MKKPSPFSIRSAEARLVRIPLKNDLVSSEEFGDQVGAAPRLILRLEDEDGFEGWGENVVSSWDELESSLPRILDGFSRCLPFARAFWTPQTSGWLHPSAPSPHHLTVDNLIHRHRSSLQVAFESAVLDLLARRAGVPACFLLGGPWRDQIPVHFWMGRVTPQKAAEVVRYGRGLGFRGIKFKAALPDPNVERLEAIHAEAPDWPVTVDANGRLLRCNDALRQILAMDAVGNLDILEDPFPRHHLEEFVALRSRVKCRVVVHIDPLESIGAVLAAKAAGGLNTSSCGGIASWFEQAGAAEAFNLPVWHGSGLDLGIATALQLHLMSATRNATLAGDQAGPWLRETSLLKTPFPIENGLVPVPTGPGLGIAVDQDELDKRSEKKIVFKT